MSEPMLTVGIIRDACEKARRAAIVGIAVGSDRKVTDFATWGKDAVDKVYADGLAEVIRRGLGYTPVPPLEDYKLQAAGLKVLYDALVKLKKDWTGNYDIRRQVAILDEIWAHFDKVPTTFKPPTFDVFRASPAVEQLRPHKIERVRSGGAEDLIAIFGLISTADRDSLRRWIDSEPMPGDYWRDDRYEVLVVRTADL